MQFFRDVSLSTIVAGLVAVLVGFTSSIALVFQAAQSLGASSAQITSWVWALCMGVGLCCIVPSLWLRQPVMVAWSTPGAAVLAAGGAAGQFGLEQAVGAFIGSALLILLCGVTGIFERLMTRIPVALASALLAGVLAKFGMDAFGAAATGPAIVLPMLAAYILGKHYHPRYVVLWTLVVGIAAAALQGQLHWEQVQWTLATPQWTTPVFTWQAFVSLGLPLFVVTMASQNLPGVIVMRSAGYAVPVSGIVSLTGALSAVLAPFGGYAINFAAITAALCTGTEAHPDPARRYTAAVVCGVAYLILGVYAAVVTGLLLAFPKELVLAIAGFALLASIAGGLHAALADARQREAAIVTFLVTLSGVTLLGVGSAFWGVAAGAAVLLAQKLPQWNKI